MFKTFLQNLIRNVFESFRGLNILWHLLAMGVTYVLVVSGFDWFYFESTRNPLILRIAFSAGFIGFFVPLLLPVIIYLFGKFKGVAKNTMVALGVAQAGLIGYLISITYKAFTGRIQPEHILSNSMVDISRGFNFGFLENGIFWGWPSSHTAVAFAMSCALIVFYSNRKSVKYSALIYAFYIGIGASIGFHWFSDFVAGAIIGSLVGVIVGKSFLNSNKMK